MTSVCCMMSATDLRSQRKQWFAEVRLMPVPAAVRLAKITCKPLSRGRKYGRSSAESLCRACFKATTHFKLACGPMSLGGRNTEEG